MLADEKSVSLSLSRPSHDYATSDLIRQNTAIRTPNFVHKLAIWPILTRWFVLGAIWRLLILLFNIAYVVIKFFNNNFLCTLVCPFSCLCNGVIIFFLGYNGCAVNKRTQLTRDRSRKAHSARPLPFRIQRTSPLPLMNVAFHLQYDEGSPPDFFFLIWNFFN